MKHNIWNHCSLTFTNFFLLLLTGIQFKYASDHIFYFNKKIFCKISPNFLNFSKYWWLSITNWCNISVISSLIGVASIQPVFKVTDFFINYDGKVDRQTDQRQNTCWCPMLGVQSQARELQVKFTVWSNIFTLSKLLYNQYTQKMLVFLWW